MVATQRALESYRELDNTFASTREHQLLVDLAEAVEQGDNEVFADKVSSKIQRCLKWEAITDCGRYIAVPIRSVVKIG